MQTFPWERELPCLSHLPWFTLCPLSPQGSEFVNHVAPGHGGWSQRSAPLCPPEKRGVPRADWKRQGFVGIMSSVTDAHADCPPPCPYGGKAVLHPLPLTLWAGRVSAGLGARGPWGPQWKAQGAGQPLNKIWRPYGQWPKSWPGSPAGTNHSRKDLIVLGPAPSSLWSTGLPGTSCPG